MWISMSVVNEGWFMEQYCWTTRSITARRINSTLIIITSSLVLLEEYVSASIEGEFCFIDNWENLSIVQSERNSAISWIGTERRWHTWLSLSIMMEHDIFIYIKKRKCHFSSIYGYIFAKLVYQQYIETDICVLHKLMCRTILSSSA